MKRQLEILCIALIFWGCSNPKGSLFLSDEFVDLKGKESLTIIKNLTPDTLRLEGTFFNNLPYVEYPFVVEIAPNQKDTLVFNFTYPDFIDFDSPHYFRLFNAPGKIVECEIFNITSDSAQINFHGELADINEFYLACHNQLGTSLETNRPYFQVGDRLTDFNQFPALADSICQVSINFIGDYDKPLPAWFKKHEVWRQKYLAAALKDNVLISKEFYGGTEIAIADHYYSFQDELPVENEEMIINTQYLFYAKSYEGRISRLKMKKQNKDLRAALFEFSAVDSLFGDRAAGDLLKMDKLSWIYKDGYGLKYDSLIKKITFQDSRKKKIVDSLIRVNYGLPRVDQVVPSLSLMDLSGRAFSFSDFRGNNLIINFWAVWCGPCIAEFAHENTLYREYGDRGLTVINICVDSEIDQWKAVSKKHDLQMINLYTERDDYKKICRAFGVFGLPKSVLLNRNLLVVNNNFKRASALTQNEIDQILIDN